MCEEETDMSSSRPEMSPRVEKVDRATAALALLQLVDAATILPDRRDDVAQRPVAA